MTTTTTQEIRRQEIDRLRRIASETERFLERNRAMLEALLDRLALAEEYRPMIDALPFYALSVTCLVLGRYGHGLASMIVGALGMTAFVAANMFAERRS